MGDGGGGGGDGGGNAGLGPSAGPPGVPGGATPGGAPGEGPGSGGVTGTSIANMLFGEMITTALNSISNAGAARGMGDPSFSAGVSGPDSRGGMGPSDTTKQIDTVLTRTVAAPPNTPLKVPDIGAADIARKRIGRQQTINTPGDLADTSTYKPTLLGQ